MGNTMTLENTYDMYLVCLILFGALAIYGNWQRV